MVYPCLAPATLGLFTSPNKQSTSFVGMHVHIKGVAPERISDNAHGSNNSVDKALRIKGSNKE